MRGRDVSSSEKKKDGVKLQRTRKDTFQRIFQGFADFVYFLEFIESHPELHELYEGNLNDLKVLLLISKAKEFPE